MPDRPRPRSPNLALPLAICVAALALVLPSSASAAELVVKNDHKRDVEAGDLTRTQKRALDIVKVAAFGGSSDLVVAVQMRGNVDRALGRGRLKRGGVGLILESKSSRKKSIVVATGGRNGHEQDALAFGPRGGPSATAAGRRPKGRVAVIRSERTLLFFVSNRDIGKLKRIHVRTTTGVEESSGAGTSGFKTELAKNILDSAGDGVTLPRPSGLTDCDVILGLRSRVTQARVALDARLEELEAKPPTGEVEDLEDDYSELGQYRDELDDRYAELKCAEPKPAPKPGPACEVAGDILGGDGVRVEVKCPEDTKQATITYPDHDIDSCDGPQGTTCTTSDENGDGKKETATVDGPGQAGTTELYILIGITPAPQAGDELLIRLLYVSELQRQHIFTLVP